MKRISHQLSSRILITFLISIFVVLSSGLCAVAAEVVVIPLIGTRTSSISPADVIELGTSSISPGGRFDLVSITPTASNGGVYTVPAGKYFVLTSMTVFPQSPGTGNITMQLIQNSAVRSYWVLPNAQPTHLSFGPGMLIAPNYSLEISNWASSAGAIRVDLHGYQTSQ